MVRYLGAFVLSLIVSNWLYAEFLLFVPQAEPIVARSISFLTPPTHDEWGGIANDPGARSFSNNLHTAIEAGPLRVGFAALGIADKDVRGVLARQKSRGNASRQLQTTTQFLTGEQAFISSAAINESFGGYSRFSFAS